MSDFPSVTLSDEGVTLDPFRSSDDSPDHCLTCGVPLEYGGRGRRPKYCSEHKKNASATSPASNSGNLAALETAIADMYRGGAAGLMLINPTDGLIVAEAAPGIAKAWIQLARTDQKVRKFLQKMTVGGGSGAVIFAHVAVAMSIMANHDVDVTSFFKRKDKDLHRG